MEAERLAAFRRTGSSAWPFARALASEAKVLLADEPTGNLDEDTAGEIIELIKKTAHELGKCVIVATHSKQLAEGAGCCIGNQSREAISINGGTLCLHAHLAAAARV